MPLSAFPTFGMLFEATQNAAASNWYYWSGCVIPPFSNNKTHCYDKNH